MHVTGVTLPRLMDTVICPLMKLNALLMCRNQQSLKVLAATFDRVGIQQRTCLSASEIIDRLAREHHSALVLDFDLPGAGQVARMVRLAPPQRRPVIFAIIGALTEVSGTFQAGANFVIYKPLTNEQVTRSLRAARGFMQPDRRRAQRHPLEAVVHLQFGITTLPAVLLDVSEDGLAVQAAEPLVAAGQVPFRFVLPGSRQTVEGAGEMVWADDNGRAGMFFARLTAASQKHLKNWINKRGPRKRIEVRAPARTERVRISSAVSTDAVVTTN